MRAFFLSLAFFFGAGLLVTWAGSPAPATDQARLQGVWEVKKTEIEGKEVNLGKGTKWTFQSNKLTCAVPGKGDQHGTFHLNPDREPKEIDIMVETVDEFRGKAVKGLYTLDGDTLKMVLCIPGEQRPTEFVSSRDFRILTFNRVK